MNIMKKDNTMKTRRMTPTLQKEERGKKDGKEGGSLLHAACCGQESTTGTGTLACAAQSAREVMKGYSPGI